MSVELAIAPGRGSRRSKRPAVRSARFGGPRMPCGWVEKLPHSISAGASNCTTSRPGVYVPMVRGGTTHRDTHATCNRRNTEL